eukprot:TRINITY_DN5420_c0_g1_i1.p1 TRINITY_DN5420_c0_g1~~TRINITY_DN5420_c0_g1_i1.p1  ORF type:complete len:445 (-),score=101.68 TRINITY_DN5420_c0_g1_i1:648-1982(-)
MFPLCKSSLTNSNHQSSDSHHFDGSDSNSTTGKNTTKYDLDEAIVARLRVLSDITGNTLALASLRSETGSGTASSIKLYSYSSSLPNFPTLPPPNNSIATSTPQQHVPISHGTKTSKRGEVRVAPMVDLNVTDTKFDNEDEINSDTNKGITGIQQQKLRPIEVKSPHSTLSHSLELQSEKLFKPNNLVTNESNVDSQLSPTLPSQNHQVQLPPLNPSSTLVTLPSMPLVGSTISKQQQLQMKRQQKQLWNSKRFICNNRGNPPPATMTMTMTGNENNSFAPAIQSSYKHSFLDSGHDSAFNSFANGTNIPIHSGRNIPSGLVSTMEFGTTISSARRNSTHRAGFSHGKLDLEEFNEQLAEMTKVEITTYLTKLEVALHAKRDELSRFFARLNSIDRDLRIRIADWEVCMIRVKRLNRKHRKYQPSRRIRAATEVTLNGDDDVVC